MYETERSRPTLFWAEPIIHLVTKYLAVLIFLVICYYIYLVQISLLLILNSCCLQLLADCSWYRTTPNISSIIVIRYKYWLILREWYQGSKTKWATSWQNQQNDCAQRRLPISMDIRPVWSESLLCAQWVAKDPCFLHADSKDSNQTGQMPRLIRVFAGRTCRFVGFVMRWLLYHHNVVRHWFCLRFESRFL